MSFSTSKILNSIPDLTSRSTKEVFMKATPGVNTPPLQKMTNNSNACLYNLKCNCKMLVTKNMKISEKL